MQLLLKGFGNVSRESTNNRWPPPGGGGGGLNKLQTRRRHALCRIVHIADVAG
jgi:hypothetical protein